MGNVGEAALLEPIDSSGEITKNGGIVLSSRERVDLIRSIHGRARNPPMYVHYVAALYRARESTSCLSE